MILYELDARYRLALLFRPHFPARSAGLAYANGRASGLGSVMILDSVRISHPPYPPLDNPLRLSFRFWFTVTRVIEAAFAARFYEPLCKPPSFHVFTHDPRTRLASANTQEVDGILVGGNTSAIDSGRVLITDSSRQG